MRQGLFDRLGEYYQKAEESVEVCRTGNQENAKECAQTMQAFLLELVNLYYLMNDFDRKDQNGNKLHVLKQIDCLYEMQLITEESTEAFREIERLGKKASFNQSITLSELEKGMQVLQQEYDRVLQSGIPVLRVPREPDYLVYVLYIFILVLDTIALFKEQFIIDTPSFLQIMNIVTASCLGYLGTFFIKDRMCAIIPMLVQIIVFALERFRHGEELFLRIYQYIERYTYDPFFKVLLYQAIMKVIPFIVGAIVGIIIRIIKKRKRYKRMVAGYEQI